MQSYVVIETDDGLTVVEVDRTASPEVEAERFGGVLVDPTLYATYEDAYDALLIFEAEMKALVDETLDQ